MQNKWMDINTAPKDNDLRLIARFNGLVCQYIHAALNLDGYWFLPFDSARDENGTTRLNDDELPTHWQELPVFDGVIDDK